MYKGRLDGFIPNGFTIRNKVVGVGASSLFLFNLVLDYVELIQLDWTWEVKSIY